jgi:hypothetical protein
MSEDNENIGENRVFVQLRLPAELGEALREAGAKANRKLPSEIIYRLQGGGDTSADALLYGWVNPERNKVLGEALAMLLGRIEVAGPMTDDRAQDRANALGMFKLAIGEVLDRLGADERTLSPDETNFAALKAREFANELLRPQRGPGSVGPRPDLEIMAKVASGEPMGARKSDGG